MLDRIEIKTACIDYLDDILKVEHEAWDADQAFTEEHFKSHLEIFPEGFFCAFINNRLAGTMVNQILTFDTHKQRLINWYNITDDGYLRKTHDPKGSVLYGVSLSVAKDFRRMGAGMALIQKGFDLVVNKGLDCYLVGARIPDYYRYSNFPLRYYVRAMKDGRMLDPQLDFYSKCGFHLIKVLPNYFYDPQSLNFGALVIWPNPNVNELNNTTDKGN